MAVDSCLESNTTYADISVSVSGIDAIDVNYFNPHRLPPFPRFPLSLSFFQIIPYVTTLYYFCNSLSFC